MLIAELYAQLIVALMLAFELWTKYEAVIFGKGKTEALAAN